ncbi:MAG: signal peptidase II [Lachnospiraceae bacterium]|nr:signal peptidase II [Lachnospiraceae bacterium]
MIYIVVITIVAAIDILAKNYIERYYWNTRDRYIFGGIVCITKSHNKGGFLNLFENSADIFRKITYTLLIFLTLLFALAFSRKKGAAVKMGLALILGGALSNESDRLLKGSVTDYFCIELPPVKKIAFNIGDFAIFAGAVLICAGYTKTTQLSSKKS